MEDPRFQKMDNYSKDRFLKRLELFKIMVRKNPVLFELVKQFDLVDGCTGKSFPKDCID
jgi:hypothetical protein